MSNEIAPHSAAASDAPGPHCWADVCAIDDIPPLGSRVVQSSGGDIAIFRAADDRIFAVHDKCPHKGGPLSQGILHGTSVTCPMHGWKIDLPSGEAVAPDTGCTRRFEVRLDGRTVQLRLD